MGGKQHAIKLPMNHLRNQIENYKKAGDKWKLKHNNPKLMGHIKSSSKMEVIVIQAGIRKPENFSKKQSNLTSKGSRKQQQL